MDVRERLQGLIGRNGILKTSAGELRFTVLSVHPPDHLILRPGADEEEDLQTAIGQSEFLIEFENEVVVDNSTTKLVSGAFISYLD